MIRRFGLLCLDFTRHMRKKNINAFAASTAFFFFLSLIPMLMLLCALLPYTPLTEADLMQVATEIAPDTVDPLLVGIIMDVYDKSIGIVSVTVVVTLWSAGKGTLALMQGLNEVYDVEEKRGYFLLRITASLYTIVFIMIMLISLAIMPFENFWFKIAAGSTAEKGMIAHGVFSFRMFFAWVIIVLILALLYTYVPRSGMGFRLQIPGAVLAAAGWGIITWGFSVYIDKFNGFSTYGSLTTIIILMLWLYACMYMIMAGALVNRYFKPAFQFLKYGIDIL